MGDGGLGCYGEGWGLKHFSSPFDDWEMEMVERFIFSLQGNKVVINLEDRMQ